MCCIDSTSLLAVSRVNIEGDSCQKTARIGIRSFSAQHNVRVISEIQESRREEVQTAVAGKGSRSISSEAAERRIRKSVKKSGSKGQNVDQQGQQDSHAPGQDKRQKPQRAAETQEATQPGVASEKEPPSAAGASHGNPQKRRRRARKKSAGIKQQHTAISQTLQHDGLQGGRLDAQTLHAESMAMSTAPPKHLEQTRQVEVLPSEQPASLQSEVTEPILAGQTVQLGSQDSLAFLVGLGLSSEAANHVLSTALSAASDRSAGKYASTIPAWQVRTPELGCIFHMQSCPYYFCSDNRDVNAWEKMEAVCRTLVDLGVKVRDLGQLFVRRPALLSCPADELRQQVR